VRNHLRRKKIISFLPFERTVENEDGEETRYEALAEENDPVAKQKLGNAEKWTEKMVMALSPSLRPVFMLRYVYDKKYDEISSILDIPINTVKVHLNRARKYLYDKFYQEYNETFMQ
jgi:RNA polymerase sigma-70 factor (ECF subfamily)